MFLTHLPDELIVSILSYLCKSDLVTGPTLANRKLNNLCQDTSLWRRMSIRLEFPTSSSKLYKNLKGLAGKPVKTLEISGVPEIQILANNVSCLKHLTTFRLRTSRTSSAFTNDLFRGIGGNCRSLKVCSLDGCFNVADDGMNALICGVKDTLEELDISASKCTRKSLDNLAKCVVNLKKLTILWPSRHDAGFDTLSLILKMPKLQSLCISNNYVYERLQTTDFTAAFGDIGSRVENLDLHCAGLDDKCREAIGRSCKELRSLDVLCRNNRSRFSNAGLKKLLSGCKKVEKLNLGEMLFAESTMSLTEAFSAAGSSLALVNLGLSMEHAVTAKAELEDVRRSRPGLEVVADFPDPACRPPMRMRKREILVHYFGVDFYEKDAGLCRNWKIPRNDAL